VLTEILTKALPLNLLGTAFEEFLPAGLLRKEGKQQMTIDEFEALEILIMRSVSEQLAVLTPVVDKAGHFMVPGLEDDMVLFGQLLVRALEFQYKDFFAEILRRLGAEVPEDITKEFAAALFAGPTPATTSSPR
jgi:hypothetical protein